jgi:hypothetical protein
VTGSGTTNYLSKWTSGTALGNSLVFDNGTNVGIGTATPAGFFTIAKTFNAGTADCIYLSNPSQTGITAAAINFINIDSVIKSSIAAAVFGNDYMTFNVGSNTERMRITSGGNVGIGTTSPATKLHLVDSVESEIRTQYSTTSSGKIITGNGFTTIGSITNDPLVFVSNNTERMRFTNGGNLLLGSTTDTGEKLQVTGATIVSGLFTVSGSTGIPATTAANLRIASGFSSPVIGRMYIGDGTGWKFHMSKRLLSTTTDLITFFDNGSIQTTEPTGYTAKPWKLGDVFSGTITPDRHIMVEIDGNIYTIPALLGTP